MSFDQATILVLLLAMFGVYAFERFRVEVVALSGLAVAFLLGLVPVSRLFSGFANPAVVTVVEILLVVTVLARTRVIDRFARLLVERVRSERGVLGVLCASGAFVSIFMNNIGALALMFPVTLSVCSRLELSPGRMLMPLSFATLLGGMCSLTGTPANLIINDWKLAQTGRGFAYFEIAWIGLPVALAGLAWIILAGPRYFQHLRGAAAPTDVGPSEFVCEARIVKGSRWVGLAVPAVEDRDEVVIHGVIRFGAHVFARRNDIVLGEGDVILVELAPDRLELLEEARVLTVASLGDQRMEVVVTPDSIFLGSRIETLEMLAERDVSLLGIASRRRRIEGRFGDLQIGLGDVLMLSGERQAMCDVTVEAGLLPLLARGSTAARPDAVRSIAIFAIGVIATATGLAPPEVAFGGVVIAMALMGSLRLREALQDLNWTIVILLACMIPLGEAMQDTGAAGVIANDIAAILPSTDPFALSALVLVIAAAVTPFVDNVSTAAVLSPIAAGIAARTGTAIEPLLLAVAIGASLDFLTPFGHHNNTVVMGAGGYRFTDFPRFGLPLLGIGLVAAACALRLIVG